MQAIEFDKELIRRYDLSGPRYTSYPTAVQFHEGFGAEQYREVARRTNEGENPRPISLYVHIPFCATVCFYCACNKVVTRNRDRAVPYLENLYRELRMQGELFDASRPVDQLHWGGGTPTFLNPEQMAELMTVTSRHFKLRDDDQGEYSIEIDPREADEYTIELLRELGFNRLSLGVQDFEPRVQAAVNRIQSEEQTFAVMDAARRCGFRSISMDLIYGLPFQTEITFARTLEKIITAQPDRLSVFNYAHLPERFKPQRRINAADLPSPSRKLAILQTSIRMLGEAGYVYIGMDHFARPDDELAIAQRQRKLYRNFQGYSTHADCDLVGAGITSIGSVGETYGQNVRTLDEYEACIGDDRLPVFRGVQLNRDDLIRRHVIKELICHFAIDFPEVETAFDIDVDSYFRTELDRLEEMRRDGLIDLGGGGIRVLPRGRLLIRNICMVFDHYLGGQQTNRYSKVI
ncbi:MAG: oxygen-independent coproporphyrinogen III oxidase [Pseudomonadota bacterium]|nr:oxygen-independent coproporphyrinogen III oxidase [Pseudomonadota bacterium]